MFTLNCKGKLMAIEKPLVMGIINFTGDSFYEGSRMKTTEAVLEKSTQMLSEGADILDLGAQTTKPGSTRISADEELKKIIPAIEKILQKYPETIISIDTYHAKVAAASIEAGARIINDISAGTLDKDMIPTVGELKVPYICMHMQGTPQTMQKKPVYGNPVQEILDFFIDKINQCKQAGITDVIIDPGFGFGKTIAHNFVLLKNLGVFKMLDRPILAGLSRKSTIYKTLGIPVNDALNGTIVMHTLALQNGADILRVHDVKEARQAITLLNKYCEA
ncbi:MAG: dihydropteroate synthase [Chitinophagaceae bacterium]|nr:dihydropteroate synthase [Chitinophagaceae bacterium]